MSPERKNPASSSPRRSRNGRREVRRYIHTGSFNRLAGRSTAPGSEIPERFYFRRRAVVLALALALLLPGLIALFR